MKVILIGARGQLGADLVKTVPPSIELFPLDIEDVDIESPEQIEEVLTPLQAEMVINTAAYVRTEDCEEYPEKAFSLNAIAVKNLARNCAKNNRGLVQISTDFVFDGLSGSPYGEEDHPKPLSTYGISKYAGELYAQTCLSKHYVIRMASLYGLAGASGKGGNFVYTILKKARAGEALKIIDDIVMSPTYTLDGAREIWKILREKREYGIYHVTNGGQASWFDFAKKILQVGGFDNEIFPVKHSDFPSKMRRPLFAPLITQKGTPLRPWEEAIEEFVRAIL